MMKLSTVPAVALVAGACVFVAARAEEPEAAAPVPVTRVSVRAEGNALSSVLEDLSRQSGLRILAESDGGQTPVNLIASQRPLWDTLLEALGPLDKGGIRAFQLGDSTSSSLTRYSGRPSHSGPFLFLAARVVHQADYRRPEAGIERFYVEFQFLPDPALGALFIQGDSLPAVATDNEHNSLVPAAAAPDRPVSLTARLFGPTEPDPSRILLARPATPLRLGNRIAVVQGHVPVLVKAQSETIELEVPGKLERVVGDIKATLETKTQEGGVVQVGAKFDRPETMTDDQWNLADQRLVSTRLQVVDGEGKGWIATGGSGASYGPKSRSMSRSFRATRTDDGTAEPPTGPAARARIEIITQTRTVQAPYEFKDLPLP
jgi:hypothetical protein